MADGPLTPQWRIAPAKCGNCPITRCRRVAEQRFTPRLRKGLIPTLVINHRPEAHTKSGQASSAGVCI